MEIKTELVSGGAQFFNGRLTSHDIYNRMCPLNAPTVVCFIWLKRRRISTQSSISFEVPSILSPVP